ncbi:MAG: response regulator [Chloroflexota bacterium]
MARILVVDDDPDFVEIARMILQAKGYAVDSAANGELALQAIHANPPDLVLLDVMMRGILDGIHVARTISEDAALRRVRVIMVSSITESPMAGMLPTDEYIPIDGWITKPVRPDDLLARVGKLLTA